MSPPSSRFPYPQSKSGVDLIPAADLDSEKRRYFIDGEPHQFLQRLDTVSLGIPRECDIDDEVNNAESNAANSDISIDHPEPLQRMLARGGSTTKEADEMFVWRALEYRRLDAETVESMCPSFESFFERLSYESGAEAAARVFADKSHCADSIVGVSTEWCRCDWKRRWAEALRRARREVRATSRWLRLSARSRS